jgi:hypothetical protein
MCGQKSDWERAGKMSDHCQLANERKNTSTYSPGCGECEEDRHCFEMRGQSHRDAAEARTKSGTGLVCHRLSRPDRESPRLGGVPAPCSIRQWTNCMQLVSTHAACVDSGLCKWWISAKGLQFHTAARSRGIDLSSCSFIIAFSKHPFK